MCLLESNITIDKAGLEKRVAKINSFSLVGGRRDVAARKTFLTVFCFSKPYTRMKEDRQNQIRFFLFVVRLRLKIHVTCDNMINHKEHSALERSVINRLYQQRLGLH